MLFDKRYECTGSQMDNLAEYIMNKRATEKRKLKGDSNEHTEGLQLIGTDSSDSHNRGVNGNGST